MNTISKTFSIAFFSLIVFFGYGALQYYYNEATFHNHSGAYTVVFWAGGINPGAWVVQFDYGLAGHPTEAQKALSELSEDLKTFGHQLEKGNPKVVGPGYDTKVVGPGYDTK
jgi:hypothetical protein